VADSLGVLRRPDIVKLGKKLEGSRLVSEDVEDLVLGHMVMALMPDADAIKGGDDISQRPLPKPEKIFKKPFAKAIKVLESDKISLRKSERKALSKMRKRKK